MHLSFRGTLLILLVMIGVSCEDNSDVFIDYYPIQNFVDEVSTKVTEDQFSANEDYTFYSNDGLKIVIPKGSLRNSSGELATDLVTVSYRVLSGISDYVTNNISTIGIASLIDAEHMLFIEFDNEGGRLFPVENEQGGVRIFIPNNEAKEDVLQFSLTDSGWLPPSAGTGEVTLADYMAKVNGVSKLVSGYVFNPKQFDWLCLGNSLINSDSQYKLCIDLPENYNNVNSIVFATLVGSSTAINFTYDSEKILFCTEIGGISQNTDINVVVISDQTDDEKYQFAIEKVNTRSSNVVIENLEPSTIGQINEKLKNI